MSNPRTPLEQISDLNAIGRPQNLVSRHELLLKASGEQMAPSADDPVRTLFLLVDPQQDFMEDGSLAVPGAYADTERTIRFLYENMARITRIFVSLDVHDPFQIFHPCWWVDPDGRPAPPFTTIHSADVSSGRWHPVQEPGRSLAYVQALERQGSKALTIWPYHCLQGTTGAAIENQLANMLYFHTIARRSPTRKIVKGLDPLTEMYGIFRPEVGPLGEAGLALLKELAHYDRILVAGQAKSHCVLESVEQILIHYAGRPDITRRIHVLEDCMSVIPGFEAETEAIFTCWTREYGVVRTTSRDIQL